MYKVSIIVITYKEKIYIKRLMDNLLKIKAEIPDLEIVVREQSSKDGSLEILSEYKDAAKVFENPNVGLAAGFNLALKEVTNEYVLFLGADAYPDAETIKGLCDYFDAHPDVAVATTKLVLEDGSLDMDAHRGFPTPWISFTRLSGLNKLFPKSNLFNGYFLPESNFSEPHEIDLCISHFMFTRKSFINKLGGFDEDFFVYGEDVDFCYRVKQNGGKIMYLPMWTTLHLKGGSVGIRSTTRNKDKKPLAHRLRMQRLSTTAMETFVRKHYFKKYPAAFNYLMIYTSRFLGLVRVFRESLIK